MSTTDWILGTLTFILFLLVVSLFRKHRNISKELTALGMMIVSLDILAPEIEKYLEEQRREEEKRREELKRSRPDTGWPTLSDLRLKRNMEPITDGLRTTDQMNPVRFCFSEDNPYGLDTKERYGFIAQELRSILPEAVEENQDGYLCIDYSCITALLVKSLKELHNEVEELESRLR